MATIVKRYPPRGNLQLFRYDSKAPFECWRCRRTKVSKLQAIVTLEEPRIICNACYGRLLSLAEIKAQDIEPWLKAEQIHGLTLKEISARTAAQAAEKQERRYKQYWKFLSDEAKRFIGTAEYLYEQMVDRDDLDFSPLIIELVKSFEYECVSGFVEPLKVRATGEPIAGNEIQKDCQDKDLGRMASYVFGRAGKPPELGTIAHTLATFINSKKRAQDSTFLKVLGAHISSCRDKGYFADQERFVAQVRQLTQCYRNPAAHIGYMPKQAYEGCRVILMGAGGALWQLIAATR
jgi:hypothetical protein